MKNSFNEFLEFVFSINKSQEILLIGDEAHSLPTEKFRQGLKINFNLDWDYQQHQIDGMTIKVQKY